MLSCQQGNVAISKLLLEWEPETITLTNFEGVTPVQCALQRGHASMVAELEEWYVIMSRMFNKFKYCIASNFRGRQFSRLSLHDTVHKLNFKDLLDCHRILYYNKISRN